MAYSHNIPYFKRLFLENSTKILYKFSVLQLLISSILYEIFTKCELPESSPTITILSILVWHSARDEATRLLPLLKFENSLMSFPKTSNHSIWWYPAPAILNSLVNFELYNLLDCFILCFSPWLGFGPWFAPHSLPLHVFLLNRSLRTELYLLGTSVYAHAVVQLARKDTKKFLCALSWMEVSG